MSFIWLEALPIKYFNNHFIKTDGLRAVKTNLWADFTHLEKQVFVIKCNFLFENSVHAFCTLQFVCERRIGLGSDLQEFNCQNLAHFISTLLV